MKQIVANVSGIILGVIVNIALTRIFEQATPTAREFFFKCLTTITIALLSLFITTAVLIYKQGDMKGPWAARVPFLTMLLYATIQLVFAGGNRRWLGVTLFVILIIISAACFYISKARAKKTEIKKNKAAKTAKANSMKPVEEKVEARKPTPARDTQTKDWFSGISN